MKEIRSPAYYEIAEYYDAINDQYAPYEKQFDVLLKAFNRFGDGRIQRILDLACGTGSHSIFLAGKGYEVVGLDLSEKMLEIAERKARVAGQRVQFVQGDVFSLDFCEEFDAVICIGQTTMMLVELEDMRRMFSGIHGSLRPGGLFIVDFMSWYEKGTFTGVESAKVGDTEIRIENKETFDPIGQSLHHEAKYFVTAGGETTTYEGYGRDRILYPQEMLVYLGEIGGFQIEGMYDCWDLDKEPEKDYLVVIARK